MAAGWASAIGAGINAVMNLMGSDSSNATSVLQNKELMKYQTKLNQKGAKWQALNIPSLNRQGIENAGYNPMLALNGITNANSNWSGLGTPTTSNKGLIGSQRVEMQNALEQQENNNILSEAQADNFNADSVLKRQQAVTETYDQLQKQVHADLEDIESQLKRKDLSYADRRFYLEQKRINQEIERMNVQNKVDLTNATANLQQVGINRMNAQTNIYNAETQRNQRTDTIQLHGPLGVGVTSSSTGYKPTKVEQFTKKPSYSYENINGHRVKVRNY